MTPGQARLTIVAAVLGSITVFVDATVVNVALPAISGDLGGGLAGQQWLSGAYLLTLGALLLVGGSLGDRYGRRAMFAAGLLAFGATSVLCAIAPTVETLVAARALQGAAGALLVPNTLGLIVARFPPDARGAAIGSWTAWSGIAMIVGPLVGGVLVDAVSWRWIFAINVVPVVAALAVVARLDPEPGAGGAGRVDLAGALLGTLGLAGPVFALIEQPSRGWGDPLILATLLGGLALLAAFAAVERRAREPMLPLGLFRERNFAVGNAATLAVYGGLGAVPFFLVLYLQQVAGYDALEAGLASMPVTLLMLALSRRFGALADRVGPRAFMGAGPVVAGAGIALFARIDAEGRYLADVLPAVLLFGLGLSLTVAPLTAAVLGGVEERHAGMASAINNAVARIGSLLAVAAIGALVAARLGGGDPSFATAGVAGATAAFHLAMLVTAGLVALGGLLSAAGIENPRRDVPCAEHAPGATVGPTVAREAG
ncbi:MAG: MFS transporter [Solirubrobacteraceae bacterium]|nr:MFS transporter [Solirubrobacteraceae bacterium]